MNKVKAQEVLPKCQTGIRGLDEITDGGIPKGRPTLVCGQCRMRKNIVSNGISCARRSSYYDEPGVFMSFEESSEELAQNVASLGFDLNDLAARKKMYLDYVRIERSESKRLVNTTSKGFSSASTMQLIRSAANRVVLDTIESLFGGLANEGITSRRTSKVIPLFERKKVFTAIITGERAKTC